MAWIELHQTVWRHRKTLTLAALLGIRPTYAAAHVAQLWSWATDNAILDFDARQGHLTGLHPAVIAGGADWTDGDPAEFVAALTEAGFLTTIGGRLVIHDWWEYAGKLIERRARNAKRMADARADHADDTSTPRAAHVQRTDSARAAPTVPNLNRTRVNTDTHVSVAPDKPDAAPRPRDEYWDTLADLMGDRADMKFTKNARGERNACVKQFKDGGYSPAEMRALGLEYQARWPSVEFTPSALALHAATLARPRPKEASNGQLLGPTQDDRRRAAERAEQEAAAYRAALAGVNGRRAGPPELAPG